MLSKKNSYNRAMIIFFAHSRREWFRVSCCDCNNNLCCIRDWVICPILPRLRSLAFLSVTNFFLYECSGEIFLFRYIEMLTIKKRVLIRFVEECCSRKDSTPIIRMNINTSIIQIWSPMVGIFLKYQSSLSCAVTSYWSIIRKSDSLL